MKNKLIVLFLGLALAMMPVLASAQVTGEFIGCAGIPLGTLEGILCKVGDILNLIVPILIALAVVIFIWGGSQEEGKTANDLGNYRHRGYCRSLGTGPSFD